MSEAIVARGKKAKGVDGDNVLYHYLQHSLRNEDVWLYQMLVARLVVSLGIWFPVDVYRRLPIPLPFVVRDPKSRRPVDQWGAPDAAGYFRDDNTMIKNLKGTLTIGDSHLKEYRGRKLGSGFIAAHVWRETTADTLASRLAPTNSFLPNLVWLPSNVAKLTDDEGSFAQTFVQAISVKLYSEADVDPKLRPFVDEAWGLLPDPPPFPGQGLPEVEELNFFEVPAGFVERQTDRIRVVAQGFDTAANGGEQTSKVQSTRYTEGLASLDRDAARVLADNLFRYIEAVEATGDR